ncbi:N-acetyltransferase family protein [Streptomyces sp. URMC 129]|uniref:GNAT family N-acetyltransferase n=1 Tax=Streptomyces sp. URMC 129 TaxID=3423407 RepID=UPI003F1B3486
MADSDVPRSSIRFPRRRLRRTVGGYRAGRSCAVATPVADGRVVMRRRVVTAGGHPIVLRAAGPDDLDAAREMHRRCSPQTLSRRYHGPLGDADRYLAHLLTPRYGHSVVAETAAGDIIALGHLLWDGDETEVALLVEDVWQGYGIGTALLRELLGLAVESRRDVVYAVTQACNTGMIALMRGTGLPLDHQVEEGSLVLTLRLSGMRSGSARPVRAGG